jgi:signal transduction histidine kinase
MKKTGNIFLILSFLYSACILALGSWWLYLIVKYGEKVASITGDDGGNKVLKMVKWEGGTFFTLLILLSMSLLFLYFKDQKKTKGLQAFFASMTHELKTPLASIKLQAEVISEDLEEKGEQKTLTLVNRLLQDTQKNGNPNG